MVPDAATEVALSSPVGGLRVVVGASGALRQIQFLGGGPGPFELVCPPAPACDEAVTQLAEYFAGRRRSFTVALDVVGTDFQRRVWAALVRIPYGATLSYGELAARLGRPGGARAVGAASGRNPLPIVIPCHRLVGSDGSLTGFGGALAAKAALLELEAETIQPRLEFE